MAVRLRAWARPESLSPRASVTRGLAILAIVWQGLWILPNPRLWPTGAPSPAVSILLAASLVTWVAIVLTTWGPWALVARRTRLERINLALLFAAAFGLLLAGPLSTLDGWRDGASVLNLAMGLTGLLLPTRLAIPVVAMGAAVEGAILVWLATITLADLSLSSEVLYPLYAIAIGAASIGGRRALLIGAGRAERSRTELAAAEARALALRQVQQRLREQARLLHETVLNTLTAISRGGLDAGSAERIRQRARDSATVLASFGSMRQRALTPSPRSWPEALEPSLSALRDRGIDVVTEVQGDAIPPKDVADAFVTALTEALSNVARHAHAASTVLTIRASGRGQRVRIEAEVRDDGVGFDPQAAPSRFGLTEAIRGPMAEVGGGVTITSRAGEGSRVLITWAAQPDSHGPWIVETAAFAVPVLIAFGVFTAVSLVFALPSAQHPLLGVAGFLVALIAGAALVYFGRTRALPGWLVVAVCLAAPLIYRLQELSLPEAFAGHWSEWASEAIVALLLVVAAAGPWWGWIAALTSWLLTQGDLVVELVQPGTAIIVAGGLFARSVRGNAMANAMALDRRSSEVASALSEAEAIGRTRRRYAAVGESDAPQLLSAIAEGRADPLDPSIREQCQREERFIRAVMRLDPASDAVHAFAADFAIRSHRSGVPIDIDVAESTGIPADVVRTFGDVAMTTLDDAVAGEPARLTARYEGDEMVLRLVMTVRHASEEAVRTRVAGTPISGMASPADGMVMLELRHG